MAIRILKLVGLIITAITIIGMGSAVLMPTVTDENTSTEREY